MSWPDDNEPRYVVASVTGYTLDPSRFSSGNGSSKNRAPCVFQVLDRAYAHKLVREFQPSYGNRALRRRRADALAAELNAVDQDDAEAAA